MEDRTLLSTFWVTNTGDNGGINPAVGAGTGTLRQAIIDADADTANTAADTINFNIPGSGVQTIQPCSELPVISHAAFIDGYSQTGASPNTWAVGDNAHLMIELDGSKILLSGGGPFALHITAGGSTVRGLDIHSFQYGGVYFDQAGGDVIQGCFVGTDPTGEIHDPDNIYATCDGNLIGTNGDGVNDLAERNVVEGIAIYGSNNIIAGNYIGTDASGTMALNDSDEFNVAPIGIHILSGSTSGQNRIGVCGQDADPAAEGNVISGNGGAGVALEGAGHNIVAGNFIGTDATGTKPLGNGYNIPTDAGPSAGGVVIQSDDNIIGTDGDGVNDLAERNIISANAYGGVGISGAGNAVAGNYIGTDISGTQPLGNQRLGVNVVFAGPDNRIGTNGIDVGAADEGNLISANDGAGVNLGGSTVGSQLVAGNLIGVDANGLPLCNSGGGIVSFEPSAQIGGSPALANMIEFNGQGFDYGVLVYGVTGDSIRANVIKSAVFYPNSGIAFAGGNILQDSPVLSTAAAGPATRILGALNSTPNTTFILDFYANDADKGSAGSYGQGQYYLGYANVTTDGTGHASFNVSVSGLAATTPGEWITATATDPDGTTSEFSLDAQAVAPASLSGLVYSDFNNDGQVDFGEQGIPGVPITLTGTDTGGNPINLSQTTDSDGTYVFLGLPPGTYTITEAQQPTGYTPGIATVGTGGGTASGAQFTGIGLAAGVDALNYNFGERPAATGPIQQGQTAGIGFWNNKNGQALIKSLNGGVGTQLGDWLAKTFPHMFGQYSGSNNLAGQNNAYVAAFFQGRFVVHGQ
jgi:hypothetical protein